MKEALYPDSRPWTRWWWFCQQIRGEDVQAQLEWLKAEGFGGVEIAWIYPLQGRAPGPRWLSPEWSAAVADAKKRATALGLGCDFTFGSLWPFGGSAVEERDASRTLEGLSKQRLKISWEAPHGPPGYVLNHLDRSALERYSAKTGGALAAALEGRRSGLFCDSWEVDTDKLWTAGFGEEFEERFGYDLVPLMDRIDENPHARYDYRKLLSEYVIREFYSPFTAISSELGAFSRVQCHGAPADLVAAYASVDVPESEAILFDPPFSSFAASAAALSGARVVSAETFTCLYGWIPYPGPGPHQGSENASDLKLLADAMFANGVNFVLWHGMPYNAPGGRDRFYASVEVAPSSALSAGFRPFNGYMEKVSSALRRGATRSELAVYLPLEDAWMQGGLPPELRRPSAANHWELHYVRFPEETRGYAPLWVTEPFLREAEFRRGELLCGEARFKGLYVASAWLDHASLGHLLRLADQGLPLCLKRSPAEPGVMKSRDYAERLGELLALDSVTLDLAGLGVEPLVSGDDLPEFWVREEEEASIYFFAHPASRGLKYPMTFGQAAAAGAEKRSVTLKGPGGRRVGVELLFKPGASLLLEVAEEGSVRDLTPEYSPGREV